MSEATPRLGLYKPADDGSEPVNVATDLNDNLEKLDNFVGVVPSTSSTPPATPFDGMLSYESDTAIVKYRKGSTWTQLLSKGATFFADVFLGIGQKIGIGTITPSAVIEAVVANSATSPTVLKFRQSSDTYPRMQIDRDGLKLGSGTGLSDVHLYRTAPGELTVDAALFAEYDVFVASTLAATNLSASGDLEVGGSVITDLTVDGDFTASGLGFTKFIRKPTDTVKVSTTATSADPHLTFTATANTNYVIETYLIFSGDVGVDIRFNYLVPTGATGLRWVLGAAPEATTNSNITMRTSAHIQSDVPALGSSLVSSGVGGKDTFILNVGNTGGVVAFQWAQNTSSANALTLKANSFMKVTKVA